MIMRLERHIHAPELNTLHVGDKQIKLGFFSLPDIYPSLSDAVKYAFKNYLISGFVVVVTDLSQPWKLGVTNVFSTGELAIDQLYPDLKSALKASSELEQEQRALHGTEYA